MSYLYSSLVTAGIAGAAYLVGLVIYRLFFHPLAKFPGPKYAAISRWHEYYYDVHLQGQFLFYIKTLHDKYGESPVSDNNVRHAPALTLSRAFVRSDCANNS